MNPTTDPATASTFSAVDQPICGGPAGIALGLTGEQSAGEQTRSGRPTAGQMPPGIQPATETIRVLHVVNGEHFSGAERVQSHLGRCLPSYGIRADFACVKPGRFADAVDAAETKWGLAHRTPMRSRFDLRIVGRIAEITAAGNYRLLHAHTPRTALLTALAARRIGLPWVYHVHSPAARDSSRRLTNWVNAQIEHWALAGCTHLITVSHSLRDECLRSGNPADRVTVVHNGVPAICYDRESVPRPGGRWVLGMVALMRPRKGLEVALDAIRLLRDRGCDVSLRCIGSFETEDYRRDILGRIRRLGLADAVEQAGFQQDVPLALSKVDALLLPSLYGEGTPEVITDGIEGLLADPGSATSLADKIECLVSGKVDWDRLAAAARSRHAAGFSDWSMAQRVADVYRRVLHPV